jgi:hypothetical protein
MHSPFTPAYVIKKHRHKAQALILVVALTPLVFFNLTRHATATTTTTWNTANFSEGTYDDVMAVSDAITLTRPASTTDDFNAGYILGTTMPETLSMTRFGDNGLEINQGYSYSEHTEPVVIGHAGEQIMYGNLLYISTYNAGLSVINTQGTVSAADDTLVTRYHTGSSPALADDILYGKVVLAGNLLYIPTQAGLSVINTQGTVSAADDTLVTRYHTGSTPALQDNRMYGVSVQGNLIYAYYGQNGGGLSVIDTAGTLDPVDDTLVTRYRAGGTPDLVGSVSRVMDTFFLGNLIYISTYAGGVYVVDTQGTLSAADDTIHTRYYSGSTPALTPLFVRNSFVENDLLYITTNDGLTVINTQGTLSAADDTLVNRYYGDGTPQLINDYLYETIVDGDLIRVAGNDSITTINTQGTLSAADDTIESTYGSRTPFRIAGSPGATSIFKNNDAIYLGAGLAAVLTFGEYTQTGVYYSNPLVASASDNSAFMVNATTSEDQSVTAFYRAGSTDAAWEDEFDTAGSFAGDSYSFGESFATAIATSGTLRLSDPSDYYTYSWIDSGKEDEYFEKGSHISARIRVVDSAPGREYGVSIYNDDWWDYASDDIVANEWQMFDFTAYTHEFSDIGFYLQTYDGLPMSPGAYLEIDWVKISTPDSMNEWGTWTECAAGECAIAGANPSDWVQYKLELETNDTSTTPVVHSVTRYGEYTSEGTYTSDMVTYENSQDLITFDADVETPAGTDVNFEYSIDEGSTWTAVLPGQNLGRDDVVMDSFIWRAVLSTTNPAYTPHITSVSLTASLHQNTTSTSLKAQIERLEANGQHDAAADLRAKYPHLFDGTASDEEIQEEIIWRLEKVIELYGRLREGQ